MSRTLTALFLLSVSGILGAPAAVAEPVDPHRRARDMIAPSITYTAAPRGAMGRLIDADAIIDPQARARQMIRAEWPVHPTGSIGMLRTDPHERARHFIVGGHE